MTNLLTFSYASIPLEKQVFIYKEYNIPKDDLGLWNTVDDYIGMFKQN